MLLGLSFEVLKGSLLLEQLLLCQHSSRCQGTGRLVAIQGDTGHEVMRVARGDNDDKRNKGDEGNKGDKSDNNDKGYHNGQSGRNGKGKWVITDKGGRHHSMG